MRRIRGTLVLLLAALFFPGSVISVPVSDAFMAAVCATLAMMGMNDLFGGDPYTATLEHEDGFSGEDAPKHDETPATEAHHLTPVPQDP